ncbi:hypothetical protein TIFTF001_043220 [Ficus carica]|uniref:Uncharacterized protein n=1 Tax=Ficus carica TaxID=3494 RepID=A0AA87Z389_FICCA|nr:hypothetical protein TIFTF001_043220 [Ficus carica]
MVSVSRPEELDGEVVKADLYGSGASDLQKVVGIGRHTALLKLRHRGGRYRDVRNLNWPKNEVKRRERQGLPEKDEREGRERPEKEERERERKMVGEGGKGGERSDREEERESCRKREN